MTNQEKYADYLLNEAIARLSVEVHTITCDKCIKWEESGHKDIYRLSCGDGWILRTDVDKIGHFGKHRS